MTQKEQLEKFRSTLPTLRAQLVDTAISLSAIACGDRGLRLKMEAMITLLEAAAAALLTSDAPVISSAIVYEGVINAGRDATISGWVITRDKDELEAALIALASASWSRSWSRVKAARKEIERLTGIAVTGPLTAALKAAEKAAKRPGVT